MRISSLSFAAVLLFSSIVCAQHHEAGNAASPPPPSPAPSAAPSPSPSSPTAAPAPSAAPSISTSAPSAAESHSSALGTPSSQAPASIPESRVAPSFGSTVIHGGISTSTESHSAVTSASPTHEPKADPGRLIPDQKLSGETRIVSAPRIGQDSPDKNPVMKPGPPQLRHRICDNGPCKEKEAEWKAEPPRSDLRRRICVNGPCPCPPGQKADKGGCIANPPVGQPLVQCQPGEVPNGTVCSPSYNCTQGKVWNGARCVASGNNCASIEGRAAILVSELRTLKAQIQDVCGQDPSGQDCEDLKQRQREALQRYQMLLSEAGPRCQGSLEDVGSLE